jgi:hypothetical protein
MTLLCSACLLQREKHAFSAAQCKKSATVRRCTACLSAQISEGSVQLSDDFENRRKELCLWLRDHSARTPVSLVVENGCRSLVSDRNFSRGDEALFIPFKCLMTETDASKTTFAQKLRKVSVEASGHSLLAMYLLEEKAKGKESFFSPYINMLPESYRDMPLFFDRALKTRLKGSMALPMLYMRIKSMNDEYMAMQNYPDLLSGVTLHDFNWARTAVITRVFSCDSRCDTPDAGRKPEECLVPIADMMNHAHNTSVHWGYDRTKAGFVMTSTGRSVKGSQLFDSYGNKCNSRYFINYGFTLADNQMFNQACVFLPLTSTFETFKNILGRPWSYDDGYGGYVYSIKDGVETKVSKEKFTRFQVSSITPVIVNSPPDPKRKSVKHIVLAMFAYARLAVFEQADAESFQIVFEKITQDLKEVKNASDFAHEPLLVFAIPVLSFENEQRALEFIGRACVSRLADFPTTLESDRRAIAAFSAFSTDFNILMMLISEKEVLQFYIDLWELSATTSSKFEWKRMLASNSRFRDYYQLFGKNVL